MAFNKKIFVFLLIIALGIPLCSCGGQKRFVIRWENYDGTVLEIDNDVVSGSMPSFDGDTPTKASTAQYSYTFSGWSPSITAVTGDKTYTAQFSSQSIYDIFEVQDGWAIQRYNGLENRLTIPSHIDGKTIVEIGDYAFANNTMLLSVSLPDTILRIDEYAFCGCTRLYDFKISNNCISVGRMCLANTSLKEVTIPESLINFGAYWTILSPIEKIIFLGNRDKTSFIGDYLDGSISTTAYLDDGDNSLSDHFTEVRKDIRFTTVNYQKLPLETEFTYELNETNRFFYITLNILNEKRKIKALANETKDSYKYFTSTSYHTEEPDWGTWMIRYKFVTSFKGKFYIGIDSLKTIDISSASNIDSSVLIGRLDNVLIQN